MDSVESLFLEASIHLWVNDLYEALGKFKVVEQHSELNSTEIALLRGLLCSVHPTDIAQKLNWKASSVKTELSNTVYGYVKQLTERFDTRIYWYNVSEWLTQAGYRLDPQILLENPFLSISNPNPCTDYTEIVRLSERQILDDKLSPASNAISKESFRAIQKIGDSCFSQGDYPCAIDVYSMLAKQHIVEYPELLLKIAQVYSKMKCYRDSVGLTYFALNYVREPKAKGKLYHLLAIAFDELCRKTPNTGLLQQTLNFYREANELSEQSNTIVLWNKFDLILNFIKADEVYHKQFISLAKLSWIEFKSSVHNQESNFKEYSCG